jgi:hypothetical protein
VYLGAKVDIWVSDFDPIVTIDGKPAHKAFVGRVTQSMIEKHGSFAAARNALLEEGGDPSASNE